MPLETIASLKVDLLDPGAPQVIHAVQDDSNSRSVSFSLYAGGAQWVVPDGTLVMVRVRKPDGKACAYDTLPDDKTPAATISGNVVTAALVPQAFTAPGNALVQIKLYDSSETSIATFAVVLHIARNVVSDAEIVSSDYYSILTRQIAEVLEAAGKIDADTAAAKEAAEKAAASATQAAGSATAAAGSASTASTAAGQAQTAATNAGQSETNAANSASAAAGSASTASEAASSASADATAAESAKTAAETAATNAENAAERAEALVYSGAGAHNSIYRGKDLGASVTAEQYAAIAAGTFDDLYIGDYWTIGGVTYRIAAFDYYLHTGDTPCTDHHAVIVPDSGMYDAAMNDTNTTAGGYGGSKLRTSGLDTAKATILGAFGADHILTHRQLLSNAVGNGAISGWAWYDSQIELMNEHIAYGAYAWGGGVQGGYNTGVDKSQLPLFRARPDLIASEENCWMRDVGSGMEFAYIGVSGSAGVTNASESFGIRPAFSIIG